MTIGDRFLVQLAELVIPTACAVLAPDGAAMLAPLLPLALAVPPPTRVPFAPFPASTWLLPLPTWLLPSPAWPFPPPT
jgi:hypothetical protein